ncbi:hypothetical protein D8674_018050 [Pyrus ussuriensis x Pyrus communis]|uniref:Uncharacterized protein n=1 Tax=Pyrus ussuriensis x Pyrus communis TaxID=2448454 RepID=A0A5N5HLI8_9ROSA|nr:hypothetical protein D8674_018050 [Pyrus ussuriensis x Pyrus communis]
MSGTRRRRRTINRDKKTLFHHSGLRPFSYRMEARQQGGSEFPEKDAFKDIYVHPMDELNSSVLQESASQPSQNTSIESMDPPEDIGFQILTETLNQTLGRRPRKYCRGWAMLINTPLGLHHRHSHKARSWL